MTRASRLTFCLSAMLLLAPFAPGATASAADGRDDRRSAQSDRLDQRLRIERDHHRGRSFSERRSRLYNPSYLRRDEQRRNLSDGANERRQRPELPPIGQ